MTCFECGVEVEELVTCEVCGRAVCQMCFDVCHRDAALPLELERVEKL